MRKYLKQDEFASINKSKSKVNLIIIGVSMIAIVVTGIFYVKKLDKTDSPSMDIISTYEEVINS